LDSQLPASVGQTGQPGQPGQAGQQQNQQNQQLFLSPASIQLAQLQAQLTLHRLKLAQGAVGGNAASAASAASAATILNQVLSNVAMSQPLLNQLCSSAMVGNPQGAFPAGALGFPNPNSALGALVGGNFNQNRGNMRLNNYGGGSAMGQQGGGDFGKKTGYPADTDRRVQYSSFQGGASTASKAVDGQYMSVNTQAKITNNGGFQRDFYGQELQGQQSGFCVGEQKINSYPGTVLKEPWKGKPSNLCHTGKMDMSSNATGWKPSGQQTRPRTDLYNPEEPTSDPKFNTGGGAAAFSSGPQGFLAFQSLQGGDESLSGGTRTLQPHQVSDYHGVTPSHLPHQCTICEKKVYNLKVGE